MTRKWWEGEAASGYWQEVFDEAKALLDLKAGWTAEDAMKEGRNRVDARRAAAENQLKLDLGGTDGVQQAHD